MFLQVVLLAVLPDSPSMSVRRDRPPYHKPLCHCGPAGVTGVGALKPEQGELCIHGSPTAAQPQPRQLHSRRDGCGEPHRHRSGEDADHRDQHHRLLG